MFLKLSFLDITKTLSTIYGDIMILDDEITDMGEGKDDEEDVDPHPTLKILVCQ